MKNNRIYKKNLSILRERFPALIEEIKNNGDDDSSLNYQILNTNIGLPTAEIRKDEKVILLHSTKNPRLEARRFIHSQIKGDEQIILVFGFGMGYHVEELLTLSPSSTLLVYEPSVYIFNEALKVRDLARVFLSGRVLFHLNSKPLNFEDSLSMQAGLNIKPLVLRPYRVLFEEKFQEFKNHWNAFSNRKDINTATLKRFDRLWTKNTFKNFLFFFTLQGVSILKDRMAGLPALVISAGPSLEKDIPILKKLKEMTILIAVDTAFQPLYRRGIVPDFVVTVDPQFINVFKITFDPSRGLDQLPILVADPAVYPVTLRNYSGLKLLTSSVFAPGKLIEGFSGEKGAIAAGGSVSCTAFDLAKILGADPIILLGLDLSYSSGKTHLSGSFHEFYALSQINRFKTIEVFNSKLIKSGKPTTVKDKEGNKVYTDKKNSLYRSWFVNHAVKTGRSVFNATKGGLPIQGIKDISLKEFLEKVAKKEKDKRAYFKELIPSLKPKTPDSIKLNDFLNYLNSLQKNLSILQELSIKAREIAKSFFQREAENEKSVLGVKLEGIDERILSFKRENELLSMVTQTSIADIMQETKESNSEKAYNNSIKLYSSMEEGTNFLKRLISSSFCRIKRISSVP